MTNGLKLKKKHIVSTFCTIVVYWEKSIVNIKTYKDYNTAKAVNPSQICIF